MNHPIHRFVILAVFAIITRVASANIELAEPAQSKQNPCVAVVLSGGGAKGAAHVGVLRALEEAGIKADIVVGTSMGAVVGGLYAAGYTPDQIDTLMAEQDWQQLLSDNTARSVQTLDERDKQETYILSVPFSQIDKPGVSGLVRGQNLANLLSRLTIGYHDSIDFAQLLCRFACVATNIVNGDEVVFTSGKLAGAIRASMAIPGMFTPVTLNDMVLVDGGLVNNFPVDVARALGADFVIGSTVQGDLNEAASLLNLSDILMQIISIACRQKYDQNVADCDVCINIDTSDYTMLDFKPAALDTLISRGYRRAAELLATTSPLPSSPHPLQKSAAVQSKIISIASITFSGATAYEQRTITRRCHLSDSTTVGISQIEAAVTMLRKDFNYADAYYSLTQTGTVYDLTFHVTQRSRSNLRLGIRFDSRDMIAAAVHTDIYLSSRLPSLISIEGRLGKQCRAGAAYSFEPTYNNSLRAAYTFLYNDIDVYDHGDRLYNLIYRKHETKLSFVGQRLRNLRYQAGISLDIYDYNQLSTVEYRLENDAYITYFARIDYSSQDNSSYPSKGLAFSAGYTLLTDNAIQMAGSAPISIADASLHTIIPIGSRFAILPSAWTRLMFGSNIPTIYNNAIGGNYEARYVPQQIPFVGINSLESMEKSLLSGAVDFRVRVAEAHFFTLTGQIALSSSRIRNLLQDHFRFGLGLKYGYNTLFGPMEASVGYCGSADKPAMLINLGYNF